MSFRKFYNIAEAYTIIRGSLRDEGNPALVQALAKLEGLEKEHKDQLENVMTHAEIQKMVIGVSGTNGERVV